MGVVRAPRGALTTRTARASAALALCAAALASCTAPDPAGAGSPTGPAARSAAAPAPAATTPQELCVHLVSYWAARILDGGPHAHFDYQEMGLSGGQYEILRAALAAARAVRPPGDTAAAHLTAGEEARRGCADRYRHGTPSGGPWP
ncbi:hypothetical protein [Streptomyces sp. NPDC101132]|uniref:hypothetical protein n=1 Tax=Streptomyces sp. NPDC101132 TaxID=3366110 RepID=UPI003803F546